MDYTLKKYLNNLKSIDSIENEQGYTLIKTSKPEETLRKFLDEVKKQHHEIEFVNVIKPSIDEIFARAIEWEK